MKTRTLIIGILLLTLHEAYAQTPPAGPTARLGYDESAVVKNPIDVFMYFIPLTSPARVVYKKSPGNSQEVWITGYHLQTRRNRFKLRCEFTMDGDGYYLNDFNHKDIIAINTRGLDRPKATTNLDYIKFEGGGYGVIEISGNYVEGRPVITDMIIRFGDRGTRSPALVELYSVDPVDGIYDYENRYNITRARIGSLSFQKTEPDGLPTMGVKLAALGNGASPDGFFSSLKAVFANLFVPPADIDRYGNEALFDFAMALYQQEARFTFPLAFNLKPAP